MRLGLNRWIPSDIREIMDRYERVASSEVADSFYRELQLYMQKAAERPESFPIRERDIRRVNLKRFPYHFLFRINGNSVRILVVRHNGRNPLFGLRRR